MAALEMTLDRLLLCQDPEASRTDWTPYGIRLTGPFIPHNLPLTSREPYPPKKQSFSNYNFFLLQA